MATNSKKVIAADVLERIEEVEGWVNIYLSNCHKQRYRQHFFSRVVKRPVVKHTVNAALNALCTALDQRHTWKPGVEKKITHYRPLNGDEISACMHITKILLESYAKLAKPSTCFRSTVLTSTTDRVNERVVVDPKIHLTRMPYRVPVSKRLDKEVFSVLKIDWGGLYSLLSNAFSHQRDLPDELKDPTDEEDAILGQYVERWNTENPLIPLKGGNFRTACRHSRRTPHFQLVSGKTIFHTDRVREAYILDGLPVYSYEAFRGLMEVDAWKAVINSPGSYVTPDNYAKFSARGVVVDIATEEIGLDPSQYTAIRVRKGDDYLFRAKYVFFKPTVAGYERVLADNSDVKDALKRLELAKQLLR